ncbi:O-acetyl-ADP-ribose deacetylase [Methanolobus profundi]|uniref:O-acetyl-ADP-ribose deacetylase (Regulator of RNase III), contains Macro domain n=1 Tax=Methanolobus profundi TaxID=487685 RepID=A0A1I4Q0E7_9EURY|nr:O-acetyl-ADP-ribose deacetylase [Methanolobus profundi]SFM33123.1 O-acetyl-ADP-ribose deacetylase (regulator of RNase III), contains Macro domain [Methanolobus profundi]
MDISDILSVTMGDIVEQEVDAIVNAANNSLLGGGGVDGAIHYAAGPQLLEECRTLGGCPTGEARITKGYLLPATWVIHTVGPIWKGGNFMEEKLLTDAYRNSLYLAEEHGIRSIAFPGISIGAYGFPVDRASGLAVGTVIEHLRSGSELEDVRLICFNENAYDSYSKALYEILEHIPDM